MLNLFAQKHKETDIIENKEEITIKELTQLNSKNRETNIFISSTGKHILFMSGRGEQPWSNQRYTKYKGQWEADGDIWISRKEHGKFTAPVCIAGVSTESGEDEPNLSPDQCTLYFQSWGYDWQCKNEPYYKVDIGGGKVGKPKGLGGGITKFFISRKESSN